MTKTSKLERTLVGVAGEYFVAAELSMRGYLASITLRNSRGIDIVACNGDASRSVSIQVKTSTGANPKWMLNQKAETYESANHFYVLVRLRSVSTRPDYYIVPSTSVASYVQSSHQNWLAGTKKDGSVRKDTSMRSFRDPDGTYLEAWNRLGLG
jgi:hypothetical protein